MWNDIKGLDCDRSLNLEPGEKEVGSVAHAHCRRTSVVPFSAFTFLIPAVLRCMCTSNVYVCTGKID